MAKITNYKITNKIIFILIFFLVMLSSIALGEKGVLTIATGITLEQTGLLKKIMQVFEKESGIKVKILAVGTGQALRLAREGNVDIVWTHYPKAENALISEGHGLKRLPVIQSRFVIVGPKHDPAKISKANSVIAAFRAIVKEKVPFVSRGDQSGTHMKELEIWKLCKVIPNWERYWEAGRGMAETLRMAHEEQAYALSENATFELLRSKLNLSLLYDGDKLLENPYSLIPINPALHPNINTQGAQQFIQFILRDTRVPEIVKSISSKGDKPLYKYIPKENAALSN